ncbi:TonB-dependent receptor plug domain-containing protein [Rugamonas rubra]|uniref:Iron complex outermembrane recepter protein n=1 Tax=Rugamonas rubra TaxID=758825 RepID=A0A1I4M7A7_9BURK|nr:TonB-dependent receptor [Rugamonas rubra]SFL99148.1 iron complex outermembrane recepter protein [Rugamonas rubra]
MHQRTKIAVAVALALNSIAAFAQQADAPQRVEITGSRIRAVDTETAQPILKISQAQIQAAGLITVGDILNQMTSAGGDPAFSKGSSLSSNRETGGQYADMRNLGSQRLLVLVNGKRWTQSVDGFTDMSTIPTSMIDRLEVLKDGASAIYGSDAIAGVINVILKKSMEGGNLSIYAGKNEKGDGQAKDFSLTYGAGNDKASLMFGLTHSLTDPVWAKEREITRFSKGPDHYKSGLGTSPWGRIRQVGADGSASGFNQILNHTGTYDGVGVGADSRNPASYHPYTGAEQDAFNSASQMMYIMPNKLTSIFTKGTIQLPMDMRFTTTAMYAKRDSSRQVAGYPLSSGTQATYPVYLDKDSYFNPYGNQVAGAGKGQDLFFYRRTVDVPRVSDNSNQTLHIDATLEGELNLRGLPWNWSVGYNHSAINGTNVNTGNLNLPNLKKAVGPSFRNPAGVIQCGTAASPIPLAECTPFDIVGGPSAATPAALNYVMSTGQATYGSTVNSATADLSGELFTLPAGALGVAGGIERREVRGYDRLGQFEQSGLSTDLAGLSTSGGYTVKEAYLEANIPLLKGVPFAELLSVDFASRYSDYSNFGTTTNNKASFMWKPVKDMLVRGTIAEGFRAPTVGDTFGGGSQSYDDYADPCDSKDGDAASSPATAARCAAAGVPATYRQLNQAGQPVGSGGGQSTVPFMSGAGNADLKPETALTRTLGFVYNPSFVPGLTIGLDWFYIKISNRINAVESTYTANQCYVSGVQSFCDKIKRDPVSGMITSLSHGNANMGQLSTEGADLALSYRLPKNAYGQFNLRSESTYVASFKEKSTDDADWIGYAGEFANNRLKSSLSLDWSLGNWAATFTTRYYSALRGHCFSATVECSNPGAKASWGTNYNKVKATTYSDLNVSYKTSWKGQIMVGANNLFNKKPVINYDAGSGVDSGPSSSSSVDPNLPIDRFFYARYNQSF